MSPTEVRLILVLEVGQRQFHLSVKEFPSWDHHTQDVLDLGLGVTGLPCVRVRGQNAPVTPESFTQVLRRVMCRIGRRVLPASLGNLRKANVVSLSHSVSPISPLE